MWELSDYTMLLASWGPQLLFGFTAHLCHCSGEVDVMYDSQQSTCKNWYIANKYQKVCKGTLCP